MNTGKGVIMISEHESDKLRYFSRNLMCPTSGISYDEPAPNTFSFNSPQGACPNCKGLGTISIVDLNKIIPDDNISIKRGGIKPLGEYQNSLVFWQIEAILKKIQINIKNATEKCS